MTVLLFFVLVRPNFFQMNLLAIQSATNFRGFVKVIETEHAGENVLPEPVLEVVDFVRSQKLDRFSVSEALSKNAWVFQNITTLSWPSRLAPGATAVFFSITETLPSKCSLQAQKAKVQLATCR